MATGKVIIVDGKQTIFDIGLQEYGSIDGDILLLQDNPELGGLDCVLFAGQLLKIIQEPINKDVVAYLEANRITPSTEVEDISEYELSDSGDFDLLDFDGDDFY